MKESLTELEQLIVQNLKSINLLNNEVELKENEKHDLLKDTTYSGSLVKTLTD